MNRACIVRISFSIPAPALKTAISVNALVRLKPENFGLCCLTMLNFQPVMAVVPKMNCYNPPALFLELPCLTSYNKKNA